jgi:hypothetical protein
MSRRLSEQYTFTPGLAGEGIIKIPGKVELNQLLVITNKSIQENLYALGDPTRNATVSYEPNDTTTFYSATPGVTIITLTTKNTLDMLSTDKLAIYTDAPSYQGTITRPYWFGTDAIERQRVSSPFAMIDADFEYGLQTTKWQNYSSVRNIPGIYEKPGLDLFITSITTDGATPSVITVTCSAPHGLTSADAVVMHGLTNATGYSKAEGAFIVNATPSSTVFNYFAKGIVGTSGQTLFGSSTYGRRGGFYAGSQLPIATVTSDQSNPSLITVTLSANHGMIPGSPITCIATTSGSGHQLVTGNFFCEKILSSSAFQFTARVGGVVTSAGLGLKAFIRSDAISIHRPFDGGVIIGPYTPASGATAIRQTKKYMRYQSGKGVMWTSGVLFCPTLNLDQISANGTASGSTVSVSCESSHGLQVGATVIISGVVTAGYNGTYGVSSIIDEQTFTYAAAGELGSATAVLTDLPRVTIKNWYGSTVRSGAFDDQNGVYWEYDGQELAVGKRSATFQLSGFVDVSPGSQAVTGNKCRFTQQLRAGSNIVIRGMTYKIGSITDDNTMTINPAYRGVNASSRVKMAVIRDVRFPQSQWNIDKLDGTGESGYVVNVAKMQMIGIQFSWYGAGFIDWMIRGPDGNMIPVHRMKQNNVNTEAYMRTANSTIRYQVINEIAVACLADNVAVGDTTITLDDASRYPVNGTVICEGEFISYTGKTGNTLTGCARGASLVQFIGGLSRTFTGRPAQPHLKGNGFNGVALVSVTCAPLINHWGSSYIMDGGFDSDRGYYFNYSDTGNVVPANSSRTAFFIRLAPSVSNSIAGSFGDRDLINRAQLLLEKLQVQSDQGVQVYGILNPGNIDASTLTWQNVNTSALGSQPSFAQISTSSTVAATPGEQNFSTLGQPNGFAEIDLSSLKELTNSAIGGYSNYPDGPDVLAVVIRNLSATTAANTNINLFWTEAQA